MTRAHSKAAEKAAFHCGGNLKANVEKAESFAAACIKSKTNGKLVKKEVAAIHLYTQRTPLHSGFNGALGGLGGGGRSSIEPYLPFCKILMNALRKIRAVPTSAVYRGVKRPVSELLAGIKQGDAVEWWWVNMHAGPATRVVPEDADGCFVCPPPSQVGMTQSISVLSRRWPAAFYFC